MRTPEENGRCDGGEAAKSAEVTGDHIVISGVAGLYPSSRHVEDLRNILYNKINPIKETERWSCLPEASQYVGQISDLEYFDAPFFKVHHRISNLMDPMSRKLLEQSYQALFDAGCNPGLLAGKKIGVFIGVSFAETDNVFLYSDNAKSGLGITGCGYRSMCANRISYYLNLRGPSQAIDMSCSSSSNALEVAFKAMARGECEAALVGGSKLCLHPQTVIAYDRTLTTCKDGKTKSFDANADGCCNSEAINVVFLQKAKDALRIYARIVHVKNEFMSLCQTDIGAVAGFARDPTDITRFLKTFYRKAKVSPNEVQYVEAFGAGYRDSDKAELEAIDEFFCQDRNKPLPVGSVMSNIGYVECASGLASVTKVLLGYQCGKMAANLHYDTPRGDIAAIREGRVKILAEHQEFAPTYTAINGMSLTGSFAHILLHGFNKKKDTERYKTNFPRLVLCSGRQETSVQKIFNYLKNKPIDPEEQALLHRFYENGLSGHLGRGFVIIDTNEKNETVCLSEQCAYFDQARRPLWFVYSGMGSQWAGMGKDLMRIPVFADAIARCHRVLEPKGHNLIDIITSDDPATFDNILHSFVGISAMQVALTDVLRAMDIVPDMIIGHSEGEIGCAYADGCLTPEETILCSYNRGLVSVQTPFIRGSMAAIGLGHKEMSRICPPEIEIACHNSADSCTISGPAEAMSEFVLELTRQGIFAKEVPCSNIAYHSRYTAEAGPTLLRYMKEVLPEPRARSPRWLSTSVPQAQWDEPHAKYISAEYYTNNFLNPVLFEETSQLIPADAVLVEVAPHALMQAILKRSLPRSCSLVPLARRGHPENSKLILEAVGRLYLEGFNPKVKALYPQVEYPVSSSTPILSHLVEWVHKEEWALHKPTIASKAIAQISQNVISIYDVEHSYLKGHVIRGKNLYPFSAALVAVWDTLAASLHVERKSISVKFENIYIHSQPILHKERQLRLHIAIQKGTGQFEVLNENLVIMTGTIVPEIIDERKVQPPQINAITNINADDIYQLLHAKDYHYFNDFRSIHSTNESLTEAHILWKDNWVTFLDGIIQLNVLRRKHNTVSKVNLIRKIIIDVDKHRNSIVVDKDTALVKAKIVDVYDVTTCGGVIMETVRFVDLPSTANDKIFDFSTEKSKIAPNGEHCVPLENETVPDMTLKIAQIGDLQSLYWANGILRSGDELNVEIEVAYVGINIVYVNKLLGTHFHEGNEPTRSVIDFSGLSKSGTRVMGLIRSDTISSQVEVNPEFLMPIPGHWTLEDAATVPLAYSLAFYILFIKLRMNRKHRICVHGATGAFGQAVVSVALAHDCQVIATVSNRSKKRFLKRLFPQLKDDHIIDHSRDFNFAYRVMRITNGRGCNLLVSCATDELKDVSFRCLSPYGVLVDTGVVPNREDYKFGLDHLSFDKVYYPIDISTIFLPKYAEDIRLIRELMVAGIRLGYVRPLSRVTYDARDAARACQLRATGDHRGRVLLHLQHLHNTVPRVICTSSLQLIVSDDQMLAMKLAERLVQRGARNILILLLDKVSSYVNALKRQWEDDRVNIKVIKMTQETMDSNLLKDFKVHLGLESIFILTSGQKAAHVFETVSLLAAFVSKSQHQLKYFALVTSNEADIAPALWFKTNSHGKMITKIKIPEIYQMNDDEDRPRNDTISINDAVDTIERAVSSGQETILVHKCVATRKTLLEQILSFAGLKFDDTMNLNYKLRELRLDDLTLSVIQGYLRDVYELNLSMEDIQNLSLKSINEVENPCIKGHIEEKQGIATYFPELHADELLHTTDMLFMPTLANTATFNMDIDVNKPYLCVVPGVEGNHGRFTALCERLKLPTVALQPGVDRPDETPAEMADRYIGVLKRKAAIHGPFYLLGYESGILVVLEMAAALENNGLTGTVFCIGGSPTEVIQDFRNNLKDFKTDEELQMGVLKHAYSLVTKEDCSILDQLTHLEWPAKLSSCMNLMRGKCSHSVQYTRKWIDYMYKRLSSFIHKKYLIKKISSPIISLRPRYPNGMDASLKDSSTGNALTYQLASPLGSAHLDMMCATIVNSHLDRHTLETFNNRNICQSYKIVGGNIQI